MLYYLANNNNISDHLTTFFRSYSTAELWKCRNPSEEIGIDGSTHDSNINPKSKPWYRTCFHIFTFNRIKMSPKHFMNDFRYTGKENNFSLSTHVYWVWLTSIHLTCTFLCTYALWNGNNDQTNYVCHLTHRPVYIFVLVCDCFLNSLLPGMVTDIWVRFYKWLLLFEQFSLMKYRILKS